MWSGLRGKCIQQSSFMEQREQYGQFPWICFHHESCSIVIRSLLINPLQPASHIQSPSRATKTTKAILSSCPTPHALNMPSNTGPAVLIPNLTLHWFQIQHKVPLQICGRPCKDSWVHSLSTQRTASISLQKAMEVTMAQSSTVSYLHGRR